MCCGFHVNSLTCFRLSWNICSSYIQYFEGFNIVVTHFNRFWFLIKSNKSEIKLINRHKLSNAVVKRDKCNFWKFLIAMEKTIFLRKTTFWFKKTHFLIQGTFTTSLLICVVCFYVFVFSTFGLTCVPPFWGFRSNLKVIYLVSTYSLIIP